MSDFASAKNRNAAEGKKKKNKPQTISNSLDWWWDTDEKYAHN